MKIPYACTHLPGKEKVGKKGEIKKVFFSATTPSSYKNTVFRPVFNW